MASIADVITDDEWAQLIIRIKNAYIDCLLRDPREAADTLHGAQQCIAEIEARRRVKDDTTPQGHDEAVTSSEG